MNFKIEGKDRLKNKDEGHIFYDGGKAWMVRVKNGHLRWYRAQNFDAAREAT